MTRLSFTTRDPVADLPSCEYVLLAAQSDEQELAFCQLQMKEDRDIVSWFPLVSAHDEVVSV